MATPDIQAFHNQTRAALNGIALGGMMIDKHRGYRYTHPTFKGLPFNSTGSRNEFSFQNKAENNTPLEDKISGGARTQKGQTMLQGKLKSRAQDIRNMELMKEGLPPNPPDERAFQLDEAQSIELELNALIQGLNNTIESGDVGSLTTKEFSALPRLIVRYAATTTNSTDIATLYRRLEDDIAEPLMEIASPSVRSTERAELKPRAFALSLREQFLQPALEFLEGYASFLTTKFDGSRKSQDTAIRTLIKEHFKGKATLITTLRQELAKTQRTGDPVVEAELRQQRLTKAQQRFILAQRADLIESGLTPAEVEGQIEELATQMLQRNVAEPRATMVLRPA